ncbi:OmpA family protein [Flavobacterium sp. SUN052]|uniref:OmpA family protein n=1 Tax=Flavobacterium sp. SUN052 TaxID=3002441 RepID=UPI00237E7578|nr:OmpA family protein [Flavobacterium sp. SUN052]MEC4005743.1 OmpA family protein [Flavobacterium sp. SUN052]
MKKILIIGFFFIISQFVTAQEHFEVFFNTNKYDVTKAENKKLQDWILANKEVKIIAIHGFTDEDGSNGSNDTLAKNRVRFIFNQVKGKIKIREDFKTISFGENFNQSKNKAENRKATIFYLLPKDIARENEILGIKPKVIEPEVIIPIEEEAMNFPENATLEEKIKLSKKGTLIRLNDINFYVNTFAIMPTSKRAIDELILMMDIYPNLKIEIQGHICCVPKDVRNLSLDRARQVKRILVSEGVREKRIQVIGFGTTKPKFPIPEKSEFEAARNRRVEIMILDK